MRELGQLRHLAVIKRDLPSPGIEDDQEKTPSRRSLDPHWKLRALNAVCARRRSYDRHLREITSGGSSLERLDKQERENDGRDKRKILGGARLADAAADGFRFASGI
jgi:hypothetical protein